MVYKILHSVSLLISSLALDKYRENKCLPTVHCTLRCVPLEHVCPERSLLMEFLSANLQIKVCMAIPLPWEHLYATHLVQLFLHTEEISLRIFTLCLLHLSFIEVRT